MFGCGDVVDQVAALAVIDDASCDADAVGDLLGQTKRVRGWLDSLEARLVRRAGELAKTGQGAGARETVRRGANVSAAEARRRAGRAATLAEAPTLDDALSSGAIGSDHVDAATGAARKLSDEARSGFFDDTDGELAGKAASLGPDEFSEYCKRRAAALAAQHDDASGEAAAQRKKVSFRSWTDKTTGMTKYAGQHDPELGAAFLKAIEEHTASLAQRESLPKNDHTAGLALAELVSLGRGADPASRGRPEIVALCDCQSLAHGQHEHTVSELSDGTPVPVETLQRWACDAVITPIKLDNNGHVLNAGRSIRTANRAQRRALRAMYTGCAWDGCDRPFDWCQMHHIKVWDKLGPTDLDNLIPLCPEHHHSVHEGRWSLHLDPDRHLTILRPDGATHACVELPSTIRAHAKLDTRADSQRRTRQRLDHLKQPEPALSQC